MRQHLVRPLLSLLFVGLLAPLCLGQDSAIASRKIDGYRLIWFDLGQRSEHGSKYSGGLGTYTANHLPMAIYAPQVDKTFFVYGGTTDRDQRQLLAMASYYDHASGLVPRPTVVHEKTGINDPHDNPSINIAPDGHVWIFISGRGTRRPGLTYRSVEPYSVDAFEFIASAEYTYPQPWFDAERGLLFLFTKYSRGRELYFNHSPDGRTWSFAEDRKLAGIGGHYQVSQQRGKVIGTCFNRHPGGTVDLRTDLYYIQTADFGKTWTTIDGRSVELPLTDEHNPALVHDYAAQKRLVYINDMTFDHAGRPVILYVTSSDHRPGPTGDPRMWTIAHWLGDRWEIREITRSTHNYDMGSLYIEPGEPWRIIGPTEAGPQPLGTGGEMALWVSDDEGKTWRKQRDLTSGSAFNHHYARRPLGAHRDFYAYWADGDPDAMSVSRFYFTNRDGTAVYELPYEMTEPMARPRRVR